MQLVEGEDEERRGAELLWLGQQTWQRSDQSDGSTCFFVWRCCALSIYALSVPRPSMQIVSCRPCLRRATVASCHTEPVSEAIDRRNPRLCLHFLLTNTLAEMPNKKQKNATKRGYAKYLL